MALMALAKGPRRRESPPRIVPIKQRFGGNKVGQEESVHPQGTIGWGDQFAIWPTLPQADYRTVTFCLKRNAPERRLGQHARIYRQQSVDFAEKLQRVTRAVSNAESAVIHKACMRMRTNQDLVRWTPGYGVVDQTQFIPTLIERNAIGVILDLQ